MLKLIINQSDFLNMINNIKKLLLSLPVFLFISVAILSSVSLPKVALAQTTFTKTNYGVGEQAIINIQGAKPNSKIFYSWSKDNWLIVKNQDSGVITDTSGNGSLSLGSLKYVDVGSHEISIVVDSVISTANFTVTSATPTIEQQISEVEQLFVSSLYKDGKRAATSTDISHPQGDALFIGNQRVQYSVGDKLIFSNIGGLTPGDEMIGYIFRNGKLMSRPLKSETKADNTGKWSGTFANTVFNSSQSGNYLAIVHAKTGNSFALFPFGVGSIDFGKIGIPVLENAMVGVQYVDGGYIGVSGSFCNGCIPKAAYYTLGNGLYPALDYVTKTFTIDGTNQAASKYIVNNAQARYGISVGLKGMPEYVNEEEGGFVFLFDEQNIVDMKYVALTVQAYRQIDRPTSGNYSTKPLPATSTNTTTTAHPIGTNIKISDGTIYTITEANTRRPYTSGAAFLSYGFNSFASVVDANSADLSLAVGAFIPPRDGKIVCSDRGADKGTCYLITESKKAGFTSAQIFKELGFSFDKTLTGDMSWMQSVSNIDTSATTHRPGVLINQNGTLKLVVVNGVFGIPDTKTFESWGYTFEDAVIANDYDIQLQQTKILQTRQPGDLSPK